MSNLQEAMAYSFNGDIETWVHQFLNGEGGNSGLSAGLKMKARYWVGPIEVDLNILDRVVGPEPHMEYVENEEWWNQKIDQISRRIEAGWDMPPLIAENRNGTFSVRDGNHRLGALQKLMRKKCFVMIWDDVSAGNIRKALLSIGER